MRPKSVSLERTSWSARVARPASHEMHQVRRDVPERYDYFVFSFNPIDRKQTRCLPPGSSRECTSPRAIQRLTVCRHTPRRSHTARGVSQSTTDWHCSHQSVKSFIVPPSHAAPTARGTVPRDQFVTLRGQRPCCRE